MSSLSETSGSVMCENIGPRERAKRRRIGVLSGLVAVGLSALLLAVHAGHAVRLTAFVPFALAGFGFFQAREHTCVLNVARGVRNLDRGDEAVTDAAESRQLALQARLTVVLLLLP